MEQFNNQIDIEEEESLISFLYRLTIANYHTSLKMIGDSLEMKWWEMPLNSLNSDMCNALSYLSGVPEERLYSHSYHSIISKLREKDKITWFHHAHVKYCPECLNDQNIHNYLWGFKYVDICIKHSLFLINTCQKCRKKLKLNSLIKGECMHCLFNLSMAKANEARIEGLFYHSQKKLQQFLSGQIVKGFGNLTKDKLITLVEAVNRLFDGINILDEFTNIKAELQALTHDEKERAISFAKVYWMLFENFPNNFLYALQVFNDSDSPRKKYRKRTFSHFLSKHEDYSLLKNELDNFKELQVVQGKVPRNIKTFDEVSFSKLRNLYYSKRDIYKKFDITRSEIDKLCEKKVLIPKVIFNENHTNYYFPRLETEMLIKTFIQEKAECMTKKEVAERLGVNVKAVRHLLEKDLLVEKESSIFRQFAAIDRKSVQALEKQITHNIILLEKVEMENFLGIKKAINKFVTSGLQIGLLFEWIVKGEIDCFSPSNEYLVENFFFKESELIKKLHQKKIETYGYCLGDVSRVLGFTERTINKMIKAKLIIPFQIYKGPLGKEMYFFDKAFIHEFKRLFISPQEAAIEYGVNHSTLYNFFHRRILKNYAEGICRKALFHRGELELELRKRGLIK